MHKYNAWTSWTGTPSLFFTSPVPWESKLNLWKCVAFEWSSDAAFHPKLFETFKIGHFRLAPWCDIISVREDPQLWNVILAANGHLFFSSLRNPRSLGGGLKEIVRRTEALPVKILNTETSSFDSPALREAWVTHYWNLESSVLSSTASNLSYSFGSCWEWSCFTVVCLGFES